MTMSTSREGDELAFSCSSYITSSDCDSVDSGALQLVYGVVPLSVSLHTTSDQATEPLATLQERKMEVSVMALTTTFTCPGAGTARVKC